jgi:hypothetical protein
MVESETTEPAPIEVKDAPGEAGARVYHMSRDGRRQANILLFGVASIWVFALWSLITILQDGVGGVEWVSAALMIGMLVVAPVVAWTLLEEANSRIVTNESGIEYRTFAGIALAYGWDEVQGFKPKGERGRIAKFFLGDEEVDINDNKVTKAEAGEPRPGEISTTEGETEQIAASADGRDGAPSAPAAREELAQDGDEGLIDEESETLLLAVRTDRAAQIANPLARFLHRQAHGTALPIYGGLEDRRELLDEIARRLPAPVHAHSAPPQANA